MHASKPGPSAIGTYHGAAVGIFMSALLGLGQPAQGQTADLDSLIKAAKAEKSVMIYGTAPINQIGDVYKAFEAKYGIKVESFQARGSDLTARFSNEAAAGIIQADAFMGSDISDQQENPHYFQKLTKANFPNWDQIPDAAKLPGDLSISYQVSAFSLFWNTNKVTEANRPRTWKDLADPKWKGQVVLVNPRASGTYRSVWSEVRKLYPDFLTNVAALDPRLAESAAPAAQQLAAGTGSIAFIGYQSNAEPLIEKGAPINAAPIEGPQISRRNWISAVAGKSPNAGRLFVHFITVDDGLRVYCKLNSTGQSILDPDGKKSGCKPLGQNPLYLTIDPVSDADSEVVIRELKLP